MALDDSQLSEVLVKCDENATLAVSPSEDLGVTWVALPVTGMLDLVSVRFEKVTSAAPHTGVQEDFHPGVANAGSTRSCPTTR